MPLNIARIKVRKWAASLALPACMFRYCSYRPAANGPVSRYAALCSDSRTVALCEAGREDGHPVLRPSDKLSKASCRNVHYRAVRTRLSQAARHLACPHCQHWHTATCRPSGFVCSSTGRTARNSSVGIVAAPSGVRLSAEATEFLVLQNRYSTAFGPTPSSLQRITAIKRLQRKADPSLRPLSRLRMGGAIPVLPSTLSSLKRDNFTFTSKAPPPLTKTEVERNSSGFVLL